MQTLAIGLNGVQAVVGQVDAQAWTGWVPGRGEPSLLVVGLPEVAARETGLRVRSALAGLDVRPRARVTVALLPGVRQVGLDLAIAAAVLGADGRLALDVDGVVDLAGRGTVARTVMLGNLALDGRLQAVRGCLPALLGARAAGFRHAIVPTSNEAEAGAVDGMEVRHAGSLAQVLAHLRGDEPLPRAVSGRTPPSATSWLSHGSRLEPDLAEIGGMAQARRALEIAAAGRHNLLLVGRPGAGKTLLARRLPGILPDLPDGDAELVTSLYSVAGLVQPGMGLVRRPPFRAPHHTISLQGLLGGGSPASPGEVSLAHHGVLFLDELTEFRRPALDGLAACLQAGEQEIRRRGGACRFPARPLVVGAVNTWSDGAYTGAELARLDGARAEMFDMRVVVEPGGACTPDTSAEVARRVQAACQIPLAPNDRPCPDRVWRIARTIARLAGDAQVRDHHMDEAVGFANV